MLAALSFNLRSVVAVELSSTTASESAVILPSKSSYNFRI